METDNQRSSRLRWLWLLVSAIVLVGLSVGLFFSVEISVFANGKLDTSERIASVKAPEAGYLKAIHVESGELVLPGQYIAEISVIDRSFDQSQAEINLRSLELLLTEERRLLRILNSLKNSAVPSPLNHRNLEKLFGSLADRASAQLRSTISMIRERDAEVSSLLAKERLAKMRAINYRDLFSKGDISQQEFESAQTELDVASSLAEQARHRRASTILDAIQNHVSIADEHQHKIDLLRNEDDRATAHVQKLIVRSPREGTIEVAKRVSEHTYVNQFDEIATIHPSTKEMIAKLLVDSRDIGYIRRSQVVNIKINGAAPDLDRFLPGRVARIHAGPVGEENKGSSYLVDIEFSHDLNGVNYDFDFQSGQDISAQVTIGKRKIYKYIFASLFESLSTVFRER